MEPSADFGLPVGRFAWVLHWFKNHETWWMQEKGGKIQNFCLTCAGLAPEVANVSAVRPPRR